MTDQMTDADIKAWFARGPKAGKLLLILNVMQEFTLSLRSASTETTPDFMRRFAWKISEINRRLLDYCRGLINGNSAYPDDAILDYLFDFLDTPEFVPFLGSVWSRATKDTADFPPRWPEREAGSGQLN